MTVQYIIGHWTDGRNKPNAVDLQSYQLLIDGEGHKHTGMPVGQAASIGGMNSITYNISCCGGKTYEPLTKVQCEAFYKACAEKLKEYDLSINAFFTHAEIGEMCREMTITQLLPYNKYLKQNIGKIDLTILPGVTGSASVTSSYIRNKIKEYRERL